MKQFFKYVLATIVGIAILTIIGFFLMAGVFGAMASMGKEPVKTEAKSVYKLDLSGQLTDRYEDNPLSMLTGSIFGDYESLGLDEVLANIEKAKNDKNISGIYLKAGSLSAGFASVKEIRDALADFKASGKFIVAYGDVYTQKMYYLCSVADKVLVNPLGMVEWQGLSGEIPFYKGTLDKLGVEMQVIRVGTFKSAVEPYIETKMSDANRLQTETYVRNIWNGLVSEVGEARQISVDSLNTFADNVVTLQQAETVLANHLIDGIVYEDEVDKVINGYLEQGDSAKVKYVKHSEMSRIVNIKKHDKNKIAIIYAIGEIIETESDGNISGKLTEDIKKVANDKNVKSVVFRVNSPGGSAFLSEQIWHAISELQKKKPVIVSMGDYAASGGYYISSAADYIVAQPNTLTGSIGIFGLIPNIKGLTNKIGVTFDGVKTNKMSDLISTNRPFSPEEKTLMQTYINRGYETFVKRCADGRKMSADGIKAIAEGRVWTGEDAVKIGLVDELGGLPKALEIAAKKANLETYSVVEYPKKVSFEEKIMNAFSGDVKTRFLKSYLGDNYDLVRKIKNVENMDFVQARIPYSLNIK
jgi:protease-4